MQVVLYFQMYQTDRRRTKAIVSIKVASTRPLTFNVTYRFSLSGSSRSFHPSGSHAELTSASQVPGPCSLGVRVYGELGEPYRRLWRVFDIG